MNVVLAETFPVGEYLADELSARGWTQGELAEILGRPPQFVSEIISGKKEITRESAAQIGAAFGTSAEMWLNLQDAYHLWRQDQNQKTRSELADVRLRARLSELAPMGVLVKRGIITETSTAGKADQLRVLLRLEDIYDEPELRIAARRSNQAEPLSPTQLAWLACVQRKAAATKSAGYDPIGLSELAARLRTMVREPSGFADLQRPFADVGVVLVYVEAFPASKIDGASFLQAGSPVIGISGRGQRLDKVLFTLLHEVAHVSLDHVSDGPVLDDENSHTAGQEGLADELAAKWMWPDRWPQRPTRLTQAWIASVANAEGVHPILVVGRLQSEGQISWRSAFVTGAPTVTKYLQAW